MSCQRITVTKNGIELQQQLRGMLQRDCKNKNDDYSTQQQENYINQMKSFNKDKEYVIGYSDMIENKLSSKQKITFYLKQKFQNQPNFIEKEISKASEKISKINNNYHTHYSLPSLDFKQVQYLKTKYDNRLFTNMSQSGNSFYKLQDKDMKIKKANYMLFQEGKIERMIKKYDKFNEQVKQVPSYRKGRQRSVNLTSDIIKQMENLDTRVETMEEINNKHINDLQILDYINQREERFKLQIAELHNKKYKTLWNQLKIK